MKSLFDRWLPALTLAAWGGTILYYEMTGDLPLLLKGDYRLYALLASVFLLTGALTFALFPVDASCCADSACGHGLSRSRLGRIFTFAIILLPIGLSFFGSVQQLQAVQARNRTAIENTANLPVAEREKMEKRLANRAPAPAAPAPAANQLPPPPNPSVDRETVSSTPPPLPGAVQPPPPLPLPGKEGSTPQPAELSKAPTDWLLRTPDGLIIAEVIDLLYAAQDNTLRADFEGKKIELKGQFLPDHAAPGSKRFKAVRMLMTCCAADARPIATLVEIDQMPAFADMEWVRIVGTPSFPVEKGRRISVLKAERVEKTEAIVDDLPPGGGQGQGGGGQ